MSPYEWRWLDGWTFMPFGACLIDCSYLISEFEEHEFIELSLFSWRASLLHFEIDCWIALSPSHLQSTRLVIAFFLEFPDILDCSLEIFAAICYYYCAELSLACEPRVYTLSPARFALETLKLFQKLKQKQNYIMRVHIIKPTVFDLAKPPQIDNGYLSCPILFCSNSTRN